MPRLNFDAFEYFYTSLTWWIQPTLVKFRKISLSMHFWHKSHINISTLFSWLTLFSKSLVVFVWISFLCGELWIYHLEYHLQIAQSLPVLFWLLTLLQMPPSPPHFASLHPVPPTHCCLCPWAMHICPSAHLFQSPSSPPLWDLSVCPMSPCQFLVRC